MYIYSSVNTPSTRCRRMPGMYMRKYPTTQKRDGYRKLRPSHAEDTKTPHRKHTAQLTAENSQPPILMPMKRPMLMDEYAKDKNPTIRKKAEEETSTRIVCIPRVCTAPHVCRTFCITPRMTRPVERLATAGSNPL